jgi:peptidoglycan/LPS O-acetylase OafA/YrhL
MNNFALDTNKVSCARLLETSKIPQRLYYMDNLRALAMMLGVVFHSALAYSPRLIDSWFTSDQQNSDIIEFCVYFLHLFRMPLFFFISGFFAVMMIEKRSARAYLQNRSKRILLPFVLFLPLLIGSILFLVSWALVNVDNPPVFLQFLGSSEAKKMPPSTMHLWFLFNLYLFAIMAACLHRMTLFSHTFSSPFTLKLFFLLILPMLLLPALLSQASPLPAADKFYPQLWSFGFYGVLFLAGGLFFKHQQLLKDLFRYQTFLLVISVIAYSYYYNQIPTELNVKVAQESPIFNLSHSVLALAEAIVAVYMTLYCLMLGKRFLNIQNPALTFMADSSYWTYLMHIPILLFIQFQLLNLDINMWVKYVLSVAVTLLICFASYQLLVKKTLIGRMLNGKKNK